MSTSISSLDQDFPRAIVHVDGDAFFASCEQVMNPALRGKPVVTGKERGIASAMSYEAKARGVTRGMALWEIRRVCPDAVILPSNYEAYSLYAERMYNIVRRYTPIVEEYSIDECFGDITGMCASLGKSYNEIVQSIKIDLEQELGLSFSVGLGSTKVIAKLASNWDKPSGCVVIPISKTPAYLSQVPVGKVWGIGKSTAILLHRYGIATAYDFIMKPPAWVAQKVHKPYQEIHAELSGRSVLPVSVDTKRTYARMQKTKTFTPSSCDQSYVFAQLSKNIENVCIKARRHGCRAQRVYFFLKTQSFQKHGIELRLDSATCAPMRLITLARIHFNNIWQGQTMYRATGCVLLEMTNIAPQPDLFGGHIQREDTENLGHIIDGIAARYGKHAVYISSSHAAHERTHVGSRGDIPRRMSHSLPGESVRKRLGIPWLGVVQ